MTSESRQASGGMADVRQIVVLATPTAQSLEVAGPMEVFGSANFRLREAGRAFLALQPPGPEFQKAFDVFPAKWLRDQQSFLMSFFQVMPQTLQKQISLIHKLRIELWSAAGRRGNT